MSSSFDFAPCGKSCHLSHFPHRTERRHLELIEEKTFQDFSYTDITDTTRASATKRSRPSFSRLRLSTWQPSQASPAQVKVAVEHCGATEAQFLPWARASPRSLRSSSARVESCPGQGRQDHFWLSSLLAVPFGVLLLVSRQRTLIGVEKSPKSIACHKTWHGSGILRQD